MMPIYEYVCNGCNKTFEVMVKFSDPETTSCDICGSDNIEKVLYPASIHFKGSGFYNTDYKNK